MYVLVMMVLASLMAFSISYTYPHRDDYIHQVEPLKAQGFAEAMAMKHQAAIRKSHYAQANPGAWTTTGIIQSTMLTDTTPPIDQNYLPTWYQELETIHTLRFCVSDEPQPTPTYVQYKGIISAPTCDGGAGFHYQTILTYGTVPKKYTKRSVLTAIRKQFKVTDGIESGIGVINWDPNPPNPHWDVFPIGGGDASELPRDIDNLITQANAAGAAVLPTPIPPVPALANGQIVIYTKLGIPPEW